MNDRNITDVIEQLKALSESPTFTAQLNNVYESCLFTAPELMYLRWKELNQVINNQVGNKNDNDFADWEKHAINVLLNRQQFVI